ncbi:metal-dependent hydrolase [Lysobacter pythonis]|uniref:Metal-dependent hydrolase n=1 Tax=Solilutibacter pythonis TaxID=2483112 RepID=A0A3M2HTQ0_9GAMM|nr:metal-dependent hydrolase [Lysobacter pythonis]RMH91050.1 metal-dependent hydrolase [Lysobacter pythonis]
MDSLTQIVLGGALAAAVAPARHRRAALLAGAALGTLPDLDVLPASLLLGDPIDRMTWHRGPSHSLLVLPFVAWAIWAFFKRRGGRVAEASGRWWWAILLALATHPALDAFTVYGTQLWWPWPSSPVMWSSIFIIDPLYTVWLLAACVAAWWLRRGRAAQLGLVIGLAISTGYLGWSLLAKAIVERDAARSLAALGLQDAPRFSVPTPFNTLLWRVVAMTPEGYVEGEYSLFSDCGSVRFQAFPSDAGAWAQARDLPAARRMTWFNHGFQRAAMVDDRLVLTDLRMGSEPDYFFNYAVARRDALGRWRALTPSERFRPPEAKPRSAQLGRIWRRIWHAPDGEAQAASETPAISASK